MTEEHIKHIMDERKGESPIKLWFEFIGILFLLGVGLLGGLMILAFAFGW